MPAVVEGCDDIAFFLSSSIRVGTGILVAGMFSLSTPALVLLLGVFIMIKEEFCIPTPEPIVGDEAGLDLACNRLNMRKSKRIDWKP